MVVVNVKPFCSPNTEDPGDARRGVYFGPPPSPRAFSLGVSMRPRRAVVIVVNYTAFR